MIQVIALDLEGTLISNAMSQIPRPGLCEFLEGCRELVDRIVIFTAVEETKFREVAARLVKDRFAPPWFEHIEYIHWSGETKDLNFIAGVKWRNSLLVDDFEIYVHPGQEDRWIEIKEFAYPCPDSDRELMRTLNRLKMKIRSET